MGLGASFWEERGFGSWKGVQPRGGRGTSNLTSTIRMLKITPLILTYNHSFLVQKSLLGKGPNLEKSSISLEIF